MKKFFLMIALAISIFTIVSCEGTYTVTTQPSRPYYERPVSPGAGYVWIDGDWRYRGGQYVWTEGRWDRPRHNRTWVSGSWESRNNGWYWRRGRWQ
jgi:hypothetical protein